MILRIISAFSAKIRLSPKNTIRYTINKFVRYVSHYFARRNSNPQSILFDFCLSILVVIYHILIFV